MWPEASQKENGKFMKLRLKKKSFYVRKEGIALNKKLKLTGNTLSDVLIHASINQQREDRLLFELRVQYKKTTSSAHVVVCSRRL